MTNIPYNSLDHTLEEIYKAADNFQIKYAKNKTSVNIENIIDFNLDIRFMPFADLREMHDVDAMIDSTFKIIFVDAISMVNDGSENRLRFSLAHEIGHMVLHREFYNSQNIICPEDLLDLICSLTKNEYSKLEWQANEFAGRLLVEPKKLQTEVKKQLQILKESDNSFDIQNNRDIIISCISVPIAKVFKVNPIVVKIRIVKENINI